MRELPQRRKMLILGGVLLAMLLGALDSTIVGPAMPTIVRELSGIQLLAWVFTIYSLASTIAVPIVGKLSDLFGRKWFYVGGIAIFVAGSALSGAAGEAWLGFTGMSAMTQLIFFRGIQGLGGGVLMANGMAIVGDMFEARERGKYQGLFGGVFGFASVLGPALGGWLTDALSWRWIFYVNVPIGVAAFGMLWLTLPKPERGRQHSLDWWGTLTLIVGLVPLLIALNEGGSTWPWTSAAVLGLLAVAAVALAGFVFIERKAAEPILDMGFFRDGVFTWSMAVVFFSGVAMFGSIMFLPVFQQIVLGKSASNSGALLTPMLVAMVTGSIGTGQFISRTGRYKAVGVAGVTVATAGMFMLSRLAIDTPGWFVILAMVLVGVGVGVTMPLFTITMQARYPDQIGVVTAATQFFRSIGGTMGVALLGGVLNASFAANLQRLVAAHADRFGPMASKFEQLALKPEALLNSGSSVAIMSQVPAELHPAVTTFLADVRLAYAESIGHTFLMGFFLMAVAAIAMLFVREYPLAARTQPTLAEVGKELLAEEAVLGADAEPELDLGKRP